MDAQEDRLAALDAYRKKLRELRELEARLKSNRASVQDLVAEYNKTEEDLRALQMIGQIIGEVLKQLDENRFIVKVLPMASRSPGSLALSLSYAHSASLFIATCWRPCVAGVVWPPVRGGLQD